jgi:hypothetical protein
MLADIEPHCRDRVTIEVRDVDTDPAWCAAYGTEIPVLMIDGEEVCRHRLDKAAFLAALTAGGHGHQ